MAREIVLNLGDRVKRRYGRNRPVEHGNVVHIGVTRNSLGIQGEIHIQTDQEVTLISYVDPKDVSRNRESAKIPSNRGKMTTSKVK
jgi:hypothetical protein